MTVIRDARSGNYTTPQLDRNQLLENSYPLILNSSFFSNAPGELPLQVRNTGNNVYYMLGSVFSFTGAPIDTVIGSMPRQETWAFTPGFHPIVITENGGTTYERTQVFVNSNGNVDTRAPVINGTTMYFSGIVYIGQG